MTEKRLTFGILCALSLFWLCAIAPAEEGKKSFTNEDFQRIAKKYLEAWGAGPGAPFIWVIVAMPNASVPLNIPGVAFGAEGLPVAGLTREVRGDLHVRGPRRLAGRVQRGELGDARRPHLGTRVDDLLEHGGRRVVARSRDVQLAGRRDEALRRVLERAVGRRTWEEFLADQVRSSSDNKQK